MNPDLEKLIELERTDREIARLQQEITALPRRVAVIEQKLARSKAQVESARAAIKNGEALRRKQEAEILAQQQKISKYREQSLEVKTNEQYRALMHEVSFAEKSIRECEDKILEVMVDADAQEKRARAAEAELKEETAEIEKEKAHARSVTAADEKELAEWNGKRDQIRSTVDAGVLARYDRVVMARGSGVAEARGQTCTACHVVLRPQTYNDVLGNEHVIDCESCGRILYYDASHDAQAAAAGNAAKTNVPAETPASQ
jgi:predicted  nucleic acid-binding Zn-ribbon protein